jgi:hypothetical protein
MFFVFTTKADIVVLNASRFSGLLMVILHNPALQYVCILVEGPPVSFSMVPSPQLIHTCLSGITSNMYKPGEEGDVVLQ